MDAAHIELGEGQLLSAPRRIAAPADRVFEVLADPKKQAELDGSGMLVGPATDEVITAVGDVFTMRMHNRKHGDYEMNNRVVEFEPGRRIAWEPQPGKGHPDYGPDGATWGHRWGFVLEPAGDDATLVRQSYDCSKLPDHERAGMDGGRMWLPAMDETLARLEALVLSSAP
jgi:uncharacterized protein YndB with AHSA1/START domain